MSDWTEEKAYDEKIGPLMTQIVAICREHNIPMAAQFQYQDTEAEGPGFCTTTLPFDGRTAPRLSGIMNAMKAPRAVALTETRVTDADGKTTISIRRV